MGFDCTRSEDAQAAPVPDPNWKKGSKENLAVWNYKAWLREKKVIIKLSFNGHLHRRIEDMKKERHKQ